MKTRSAKAKGKRLEQWIKEQICQQFKLTDDDIRVTIGSETGSDIKLSKTAQKKFPYKIEAKNREVFKTIYNFYNQAAGHEGEFEPLLIIKMNRKPPLVILDAEYFFRKIFNE